MRFQLVNNLASSFKYMLKIKQIDVSLYAYEDLQPLEPIRQNKVKQIHKSLQGRQSMQ